MMTYILNLFERFRRYKTQWVEDLPDNPERNTIYIIGGRQHPFHAAVVCPRKKCSKVIHLEISPESKKRWEVTEHKDKTISLSPSIHAINLPCNCHYWIKKGRIVWYDMPTLLVPKENKIP